MNQKEKDIKDFVDMCKRSSNVSHMGSLLSGLWIGLKEHGIHYDWLEEMLTYYDTDDNYPRWSKMDLNVFYELVRRGLKGEIEGYGDRVAKFETHTASYCVRCEGCERLVQPNQQFYVIEDDLICCEECKKEMEADIK